jgi:hypothetical protein
MMCVTSLSATAAIKYGYGHPHSPGSPQNHRQDGQIGQLPEYNKKKRGGQRCGVQPSRGVDIEQDNIVDDEGVSEPDKRDYDECETREMFTFGRLCRY